MFASPANSVEARIDEKGQRASLLLSTQTARNFSGVRGAGADITQALTYCPPRTS